MAQELLVTLTDDLDGSDADETIMFALDGAGYEIDLNADHAAALRKGLAKYVAAARTANPSTGLRSRTTTRQLARRRPDIDPKAVRVWADEHGIEVSRRGRIPASILDQYRSAGGA